MSDPIEIIYSPDPVLDRRAAHAGARRLRRGVIGWVYYVLAVLPFIVVQLAIWGILIVLHRRSVGEPIGEVWRYGYLVLAMIIIAGYARLLSILKYRILLGSPDDRSQVTMIFDPEGVWIEDEDSKLELSWSAIDGISAIRGGFAVHAGIVAFGVPNDALPQNVTLEKLRDQAEAWSKSQVFA